MRTYASFRQKSDAEQALNYGPFSVAMSQVDCKPMPIVGPGTYELRLQTDGAYRVFYSAKFEEAAYVLHAFQKKAQKTSKHDIALGQQRYEAAQRTHRFRQAKIKHPGHTRQ